jgi:hypothetical protein
VEVQARAGYEIVTVHELIDDEREGFRGERRICNKFSQRSKSFKTRGVENKRTVTMLHLTSHIEPVLWGYKYAIGSAVTGI